VNLLREALRNLTEVCDCADNDVEAEAIFTGNRGRPSYNIPYEQVTFLVERRFSTKQMASILGVSERTVQRRLQHFGMSIRGTYATLTDQELDSTIQEILSLPFMCHILGTTSAIIRRKSRARVVHLG
jgi:AraC-like DNA-binding protein